MQACALLAWTMPHPPVAWSAHITCSSASRGLRAIGFEFPSHAIKFSTLVLQTLPLPSALASSRYSNCQTSHFFLICVLMRAAGSVMGILLGGRASGVRPEVIQWSHEVYCSLMQRLRYLWVCIWCMVSALLISSALLSVHVWPHPHRLQMGYVCHRAPTSAAADSRTPSRLTCMDRNHITISNVTQGPSPSLLVEAWQPGGSGGVLDPVLVVKQVAPRPPNSGWPVEQVCGGVVLYVCFCCV